MTAHPQAMLSTRFDPTHGAVHAAIEIAAPPEEVFRSLTDPRELAAWWGAAEGRRTHDWQVDARPGGAWSVRTTDAGGAEGTVRGEFRVVDPPRVLECSWEASWDDFAPTTVRYELAPALVRGVSGTRLTVTHTGFAGSGVTCMASAGAAPAWGRAPRAALLLRRAA